MLGSWIEICNKQQPTNVEDVLLTNIWDNKYIKIDNKDFFYRMWYEKNIHFIKDILNDEGNLMDFNQFRDKYDLQINYMQYYGVRSAVELYIRKIGIAMNIDSLTNCFIPFNIKLLLKSRRGCRDMYQVLNKKEIIPNSQIKWNRIFEIPHLNWHQIYSIPAKCCNNTKIHWFQFRILHRILATNDLLFKCNIKQDNLCSFCKKFPEKIEHLFWQCNIVMKFWEMIERWIYEKNNYLLNVDKQRAILGIMNVNEYNKPINYILILTRYYIYKCRINDKQLNLLAWIHEVKFFIQIEKMIAIKTDRYHKFIKYWETWLQLFEVNYTPFNS